MESFETVLEGDRLAYWNVVVRSSALKNKEQKDIFYELLKKADGCSKQDLYPFLKSKEGGTPNGRDVSKACNLLSDCLKEFSSTDSASQLSFVGVYKPANKNSGRYAVAIEQRKDAAWLFWEPQIDRRDATPKVTTLVSTPTFFRDDKNQIVLRFLDVNIPKNDKDRAQEKLKVKLKELNLTLPNTSIENVYPSSLYLLKGEVDAREAFCKWLRNVFSVRQESISISKDTCLEIALASPSFSNSYAVLFGHPRVSALVRDICKKQDKVLPFLIEEEVWKEWAITSNEGLIHKKALAKLDLEYEKRNTSSSKIVKTQNTSELDKYTQESPAKRMVLIDHPPNGTVYAVITRIRNPASSPPHCFLTLISSDYTLATPVFMEMLTKPSTMNAFLMETQWGAWPKEFQLVLATDVEQNVPGLSQRLIAWAPINQESATRAKPSRNLGQPGTKTDTGGHYSRNDDQTGEAATKKNP